MKLYSNWKTILRKAWSVRLMILAGLLSAMEVVLPLYIDSIDRGTFAILSIIATGGAFVARLVAQSTVENKND